jgi:GTP-binding protein HflX
VQDSQIDIPFHTLKDSVLLLPAPLNKQQEFLNKEMRLLVKSANYHVDHEYEVSTNNSNYLFSPYHLREIKYETDLKSINLSIIAGTHLTAKQYINMENFFEYKIIDKFQLILEIFASRAMTEEAKLQIELAQLKYERPRERLRLMNKLGLEGAWHTERTGFWGPGETPLNILDATLTRKESYLKKRLTVLKNQREERRRARKRYHHDSVYVSLVGYTSAGKSTVLNSLTQSNDSRVSSRLFETLDTRVRSFKLEDIKIFLTDTVGFIEDLPTFLIDSFRSTLEESLASDILFIIIDGSEPPEHILNKTKVSVQTINEINPKNHRVLVLNKIDLIDKKDEYNKLRILEKQFPELPIISISAIENNIESLLNEIAKYRPKKRFICFYPPNHEFRSFCYEFAYIESEEFNENDWAIKFSLRKPDYGLEIIEYKAKELGIKIDMKGI